MRSFSKILVSVLLVCSVQKVFAADASGTVTVPAQTTPSSSSWSSLLQKKYNLTDAQVKSLSDSKLPESEQAKIAQLAKSSGKTVDEVLKMRLEDKMGWGKIAKTLGVHPGELGKAVSDLRKEQNAEKKKERAKQEDDKKHDDDKNHEDHDDKMGAAHGHMEGHGKPDHPGHGKK
jgi:hypothetical protein